MITQINTLLSELTLAYRVANEKLLCEVGLHSSQAQVLSSLWQKDGQTQADICRSLNISSATVNLLVSKLEKKKLVRCKKCPKDKRLIRIYLTAKGLKARPKIEAQWNKIDEIILKDFSDTEKLMVMMLLEKIKKNLQTYDFE